MPATNGAQLISRLDERVDAKCLSEEDPNLWKAIPYETENFKGIMLGYGGGTNPVPITIRLGMQGVYRIWLGVYYCLKSQIRVRLSGDLCCQRVVAPPERDVLRSGRVLYEIFWKEADLTMQDLILEGVVYGQGLYPGGLAYIRLESAKAPRMEPKREVLYPLAITDDGSSIFGELPHRRPEDLLELLEDIPEDSCMRILLWGNGDADVCNYPTKVGTPGIFNFHYCFHYCRNMELWRKKGWDSLKLMREYTRKRKWEFHVYLRMEAFGPQFPFDYIRSKFFYDHPEYHCFDRNGQRVARLSYAYPEVQEHMLNLIKEIATYEPDGICLAFNRGIPVVLYEQIMVEGFKKKYGVDPRELEECDPHWMDYQAQVVTPFVKRTRVILKNAQHLSAMVPGNELDCRRWGLDVASWVKGGMVNDLFPVGQRFDGADIHRDDPDSLDFKYFAELEGRERIRLIPMLYPWDKFQQDYQGWRQLIYSFLDQGADGYAVWDAQGSEGPSLFPRVGYLGYKERENYVRSKVRSKKIKLLSMGGFRMDRYHYFEVV